jgi:4-hydroxy-tetrahydrodipicolinate synthase
MPKMQIQGAMTALVTPFNEGKLDESRLREQIEYQIRNGIDGLVPVGTTGESPTLDFDEHERVIALAVEVSRGRVPVIAGTGGNATTEALELHSFAKRAGANACLSVNPYYNKPTQEGLYRHFMTLADRVDLPIVLYNIPGRTGITMTAQTVARLYKHSNIIAIKEATGIPDMTSEILSLCDITVVSGDDSLTLPLMAIGATGIISVLSNLMPAAVKKMTKHCLEGDFAEGRKLHQKLFPLTKSIFVDGNPVGIKCAMQVAGLDSGQLRLPLWEASEGTKKLIEQCMKEAGAPFAA